jgi:hypothetical protein
VNDTRVRRFEKHTQRTIKLTFVPVQANNEASDTGIIFTGAGRPCGSRIEFEESPVDEPVAAVSFVESSPNATKELSSTFDESVTEVFDSTALRPIVVPPTKHTHSRSGSASTLLRLATANSLPSASPSSDPFVTKAVESNTSVTGMCVFCRRHYDGSERASVSTEGWDEIVN